MHWPFTFIYMEAKFMPLKKDKNDWHHLRLNFSEKTAGYTLFDHQRNEETLEAFKVEPADKKLRIYKSNWPCNMTCNKN